MKKRLIDIINELNEIVSAGKCSIELANKIEVELDDLFKEDMKYRTLFLAWHDIGPTVEGIY